MKPKNPTETLDTIKALACDMAYDETQKHGAYLNAIGLKVLEECRPLRKKQNDLNRQAKEWAERAFANMCKEECPQKALAGYRITRRQYEALNHLLVGRATMPE